jgi:predicted PurR-regulated permease PerM
VPGIVENTVSDQEPQQLDIDRTARLFQDGVGVRSLALTGIFVLGCFYTLYFVRDFFIPLVFALFFSFLLSPAVRLLRRARIPMMIGSAIVIGGCLALIGGISYELSGPVSVWIERVPEISSMIRREMQHFSKPVETMTQATEQVQNLAKSPDAPKRPQQIELRKPSPLAGLFSKHTNSFSLSSSSSSFFISCSHRETCFFGS